MTATATQLRPNTLDHWQERVDLAAAFRWTARLNMHEAVANHFSVAVNDDGTKFLMNPNQVHFSRIKASDLLLLDANDPEAMNRPDAPDPTAWGLHGAIHRLCPHARVALHVHSIHATLLATLDDPVRPSVPAVTLDVRARPRSTSRDRPTALRPRLHLLPQAGP